MVGQFSMPIYNLHPESFCIDPRSLSENPQNARHGIVARAYSPRIRQPPSGHRSALAVQTTVRQKGVFFREIRDQRSSK
jgi:hypothetical protein